MDVGGDLELGDIFETLEDYHEPHLAPIHHDDISNPRKFVGYLYIGQMRNLKNGGKI